MPSDWIVLSLLLALVTMHLAYIPVGSHVACPSITPARDRPAAHRVAPIANVTRPRQVAHPEFVAMSSVLSCPPGRAFSRSGPGRSFRLHNVQCVASTRCSSPDTVPSPHVSRGGMVRNCAMARSRLPVRGDVRHLMIGHLVARGGMLVVVEVSRDHLE